MIREFISKVIEQKYLLMLFTAVIYIFGLVGFFSDCAILIFVFLSLFFILLLWKNLITPKLILFWVFIFFFAFFNASFRINSTDELAAIAPNSVMIKGQVVTIPDMGSKKRERFFFKVNEITYNDKTKKVNAKTFVSVEGNPDINVGDYYELSGKLRKPFKVSNPSQFDYAKYLRNFNTYTVFYAESFSQLNEKLSVKWKFLQGLNNKRKEILSYHSKYIQNPNIEILGGVVFGDDAVSPPEEIKRSFINAGILHILAASGMNVALIYGIFFFILKSLKVSFKINVLIGIITVILYTFMTGMGPSVIRASVILVFILIGKLMDRDANSLSLLSLVAILMLIYNPAYINDVGFQLSFVVTFGLLINAKVLISKFEFTKLPSWVLSTILIPVIAQFWVAPIQMFYFNSFCTYSIFANIAIMPFITVISFGGFISSTLAMIKPLATYICQIFDIVLNPLITCLVNISDFFSNLHPSLITMPKPTFLQMFLYYLLLLVITHILYYRFSKKNSISALLIILIFGLTIPKFSKGSELIFFDVQNADCFLYKTAANKYFVIDTGKLGFNGNKNQINYIMMEYLKDEGIRNIEGLILTHFDSDHAGGALDLIKEMKVKKIYVNSLTNNSNIAKEIYSSSVKVEKVKNNSIIYKEGNIKIKTFIAENIKPTDGNEYSVITLINDDEYKILLMGDAGIEAYEKLQYVIPKNINVLKVGHHGAKNVINKKMMEALSPEFSILSTGINRYGHPNKATLQVLSSSKILRTDRNNAIMIKNKAAYVFDKKAGWVLVP